MMIKQEDYKFMQFAVDQARKSFNEGGIPIGSIIVHNGQVIGAGHNKRVQEGSPILHGEMDALNNAGRKPSEIYADSTIYTTLSPCSMCSGAILLYGIPRVVIGENKTFMGEEVLLKDRGVRVIVLDDMTCVKLMEDFIELKPTLWNEDIGE